MLLAKMTRNPMPHKAFRNLIWFPSHGGWMTRLNFPSMDCQPLTPGGDLRPALEHFRYPQAGALGGILRQGRGVKEAAGDDLAVGLRRPVLAELPDHIDRDVVAA